jgi:tripartite-type tricarboxylate transporter receptor subunit TctC
MIRIPGKSSFGLLAPGAGCPFSGQRSCFAGPAGPPGSFRLLKGCASVAGIGRSGRSRIVTITNVLSSGIARAILAIMACLAPIAIQAQTPNWPSRTITFVVPFPAGGTTDIVGRLVAAEVSAALGQTIIIDNRGGANGNIGSAAVARAAPDGYTFLLTGVGSNAVNHGIYQKMPYDSRKDFAHITQLTNGPNVLVVNKDFPAGDLKQLIALIKASPGKYNYASSGNGASGHMAMELLKLKAGLDLQHVPYRGGAPAMNDVISGQVPMMFINQDMAFAQAAAGTVKMIGVASLERNPSAPAAPTIAEQGFAGFAAVSWNGLAAPAGTPKDVIDRMHAEVRKALQSRSIADKLISNGFVIGGNTPDEQSKFVSDEIDKWTEVATTANVKIE